MHSLTAEIEMVCVKACECNCGFANAGMIVNILLNFLVKISVLYIACYMPWNSSRLETISKAFKEVIGYEKLILQCF